MSRVPLCGGFAHRESPLGVRGGVAMSRVPLCGGFAHRKTVRVRGGHVVSGGPRGRGTLWDAAEGDATIAGVAVDTLGRVIEETLLEAMEKMEKAVEHTQSQFGTVRSGRATPSLVERINVEYYGSPVPLQQLASITVPEARQLLIKPHDRSVLEAVEKAIRESDLGLAPNNDGIAIRLSLPQLTEERRREYVKVARGMAEEGRIALRSVRRDAACRGSRRSSRARRRTPGPRPPEPQPTANLTRVQ